MLGTVYYGSLIQAFAPLAIAVLAVGFHPALSMLAIAAAMMTLIPVQFTSFIYLSVVATHSDGDVASFNSSAVAAANQGRGWIVAMGVVFQELTRVALAYAVVRAEWYFRRHHQVLFSSRFRMVPVGAALGVGMACTLSLLTYAALLEATVTIESVSVSTADGTSTLWDFDACPQLPYLYFQSLAWFFSTISQVAWSVVVTVAIAAIVGSREVLPMLASPIPANRQAPIPRPSSLRRNDGIAGLAIVFGLHFLSSMVSLVNSGAYDWDALSNVASRGCLVSLPVQGLCTFVSLLVALAVMRMEVVKRIDPGVL
jgi:hypothetical protein